MKNKLQHLLCLISLTIFGLGKTPIIAQLEWGTHFMNNTLTQSNLTNPALFSDFNVSITLPSTYLGFSNSGFKFNEVLTLNENVLTLDMDQVLAKIGADGLTIQNHVNVEAFGLNIQGERTLFNLHHGIRVINSTFLPSETLQMLWGGNSQFIDETIDIGIQQNFLAYHEIGLAMGFKIKKQLTVGARIKYLKGLATIQTPRAKATIYTSPEFYQLTSETDYLVQTGGFPGGDLEDIDPLDFDSYDKKLFGGNSGYAFDLGMTYRFNKKLTLEVSINNLGWINWKEDAYNYVSQGGYEFDGLDLKPLIEDEEITTDQIVDTVTNIFQFENTETTFKTSPPASGYASLRYELTPRLYASGFVFMDKYQNVTNLAGGVNLKKDFGTFWTLGVQYVYHNHSKHNVGLMTALRLGFFQFYVTTDNVFPLLDPLNTQNFNVRTGMNLTFGNKYKKRKRRQKEILLAEAAAQDSLNTEIIVSTKTPNKQDYLTEEEKKELEKRKAKATVELMEKIKKEENEIALLEKQKQTELANQEALIQQKAALEQQLLEKQKQIELARQEDLAKQKAAEEKAILEKQKQKQKQIEIAQQENLAKQKAAEEKTILEKQKQFEIAQQEGLAQQKAAEEKALLEKQKQMEIAQQEDLAKQKAAEENAVLEKLRKRKEANALLEKQKQIEIAQQEDLAKQKAAEEKALLEKQKQTEIAQQEAQAKQQRTAAENAVLEKLRKRKEANALLEKQKQKQKQMDMANQNALAQQKAAEENALLEQEIKEKKAQALREEQQLREENKLSNQRRQTTTKATVSKFSATRNFGNYFIKKKTSLRQAATSSSKVLKRVDADEEVKVLEKTSKYWWKVEYAGKTGYVKALLLEK